MATAEMLGFVPADRDEALKLAKLGSPEDRAYVAIYSPYLTGDERYQTGLHAGPHGAGRVALHAPDLTGDQRYALGELAPPELAQVLAYIGQDLTPQQRITLLNGATPEYYGKVANMEVPFTASERYALAKQADPKAVGEIASWDWSRHGGDFSRDQRYDLALTSTPEQKGCVAYQAKDLREDQRYVLARDSTPEWQFRVASLDSLAPQHAAELTRLALGPERIQSLEDITDRQHPRVVLGTMAEHLFETGRADQARAVLLAVNELNRLDRECAVVER